MPLPSTWLTSRPPWSASPARCGWPAPRRRCRDPQLATPAGLVAARIGRGVAISVDGELRALHPRPAGRALAARFAALHARLLRRVVARSPRRRPAGAGGPLAAGAPHPPRRGGLAVRRPAVRRGGRGGGRRADRHGPGAAAPAAAGRGTGRTCPGRAAPAAGERRPAATRCRTPCSPWRAATAGWRRRRGCWACTATPSCTGCAAARDERGLDPRRPQDALRILSEARRAPAAPDPLIRSLVHSAQGFAPPLARTRQAAAEGVRG